MVQTQTIAPFVVDAFLAQPLIARIATVAPYRAAGARA
jgi:hypothetical protein